MARVPGEELGLMRTILLAVVHSSSLSGPACPSFSGTQDGELTWLLEPDHRQYLSTVVTQARFPVTKPRVFKLYISNNTLVDCASILLPGYHCCSTASVAKSAFFLAAVPLGLCCVENQKPLCFSQASPGLWKVATKGFLSNWYSLQQSSSQYFN